MTSAPPAWLEEARRWADELLERHVPAAGTPPARLHEALRYAILGGGKRLRPALVWLVCTELGGDAREAERAAVALELVHTYSLVHDDLPCMDDDELRRGRPTVHVAFDEATAVLVGDALLTLAFEVLADAHDGARQAGVLARAAGSQGMVGGQVLDLTLDRASGDALERVLEMHALKTAALFAAAAEMGAIAAGVEPGRCEAARAFGRAVGVAFQAIDDVLDVTGDAGSLGKTPGKDRVLERATLVAAVGLDAGQRKAQELASAARAAWTALAAPDGDRAGELIDYVLSRPG